MLEKLEKKFGKYAINNLIYYILGAYVIGYILYMVNPQWYSYIVLDPTLVMKGQVWRLFTWLCTIPQSISIWLIFMFLFYFYIGRTLEQEMGAFKYNAYIFSGWFLTTLGTMLVYWISYAIGGAAGAIEIIPSTYYLNLTSFLTFALLFPEARVYLFGILPVKMKVLAWIDGIYLALQMISGLIVAIVPDEALSSALTTYLSTPASSLDVAYTRQSGITLLVTILISMLNFFIFFFMTSKSRADARKRRHAYQEKAQAGAAMHRDAAAQEADKARQSRYRADSAAAMVHKCAVCGRTNLQYPDLQFRYCSKCSGSHEYCQDHLFTHEHVK